MPESFSAGYYDQVWCYTQSEKTTQMEIEVGPQTLRKENNVESVTRSTNQGVDRKMVHQNSVQPGAPSSTVRVW